MLKVAIMLLSPPNYLFSIEIEISTTVLEYEANKPCTQNDSGHLLKSVSGAEGQLMSVDESL